LPINDITEKDDDGSIRVVQQGIRSRTSNQGFAYNRFDFIITNPPFGSNIKQTEQAYMRQYDYALSEIDWLNPNRKETARPNQKTEILFIEQCHNYLTEGGYLAIVVPDGILTNSSLQYVRDEIEENYRIVAVVSLPQTAFQATGAGVKSSVLFLKKYTAKMTEKIKDQKLGLQDTLKDETEFNEQIQQINQEKAKQLKELIGFDNPDNLKGKSLKGSESYQEWRKTINAQAKEKADQLKENLFEQYIVQKQNTLEDYPIFMAIAEDIGYDATGKKTAVNELDFISEELARFIDAIEKGEV